MPNSSLLIREARLDDPHDAESVVKLVDSYASDIIGGGKKPDARSARAPDPGADRPPVQADFWPTKAKNPSAWRCALLVFRLSGQTADQYPRPGRAAQPPWPGIGHRLIDAVAVGRELELLQDDAGSAPRQRTGPGAV